MEQALTREQLSSVLDNIDAVPFIYGVTEGRFLYLSGACEALFGRSRDEITAEPTMLTGMSREKAREVFTRMTRGHCSRTIQHSLRYRIHRPDGQSRWVDGRIALDVDDLSRIRRVSGVLYDVTERRKLEKELESKSRLAAVGMLAAGIVHEIGNPLAFISTRLQRLRAAEGPKLCRESVPLLLAQTERIQATLRRISSFEFGTDDGAALCDVPKLLAETIETLQLDPRSHKVAIEYRSQGECPKLFGVCDQLRQVFLNLGLNALDAMREGGRLTVETHVAGRCILVDFKDCGGGIPAAHIDRIFEPFFSGKPPGRNNMGLGLYLARTFVENHGGTLVCDSSPGGTHFRVTLPFED